MKFPKQLSNLQLTLSLSITTRREIPTTLLLLLLLHPLSSHHAPRNPHHTSSNMSGPVVTNPTVNPAVTPAHSKKLVVVGDGGCGKTCLLISYSQGFFPDVPPRLPPSLNSSNPPAETHEKDVGLWVAEGAESVVLLLAGGVP